MKKAKYRLLGNKNPQSTKRDPPGKKERASTTRLSLFFFNDSALKKKL